MKERFIRAIPIIIAASFCFAMFALYGLVPGAIV